MASTTERLGIRLKALVLARLDMQSAHETAAYLLGEHEAARGHDAGLPLAARRTLETGLVVTYARPFTESRGGLTVSPARNLSPDLLAVHKQLLDLRKQFFAHNDNTPWRQLRHPEQVDELLDWPENLPAWIRDGLSVEGLLEQWTLPTRGGLEAIQALAMANHERFADEIEQVVGLLRAESPATRNQS